MIIFDEKKHAEKMLKTGEMSKHKVVYELYILTKYYLSEGLDLEEAKEKLILFCEKHIEHFNMVEWYKIINRTVSSAMKGKFITGKEVDITRKELDVVLGLEKLNEQKVAFALLVLHKFYDYKKFEVSIEDLYRLCKLNINSKTKLELLQSLTAKELIDINMGSKRWVKFADKKGESVITIKILDDFIYELMKCLDENKYSNCETCSKAIKLTSNRKKYCDECWKEKELERQRDKWHKNKNKYRSATVLENSQNH